MAKQIAMKFGELIIVLLVVSFASFALLSLVPGDPAFVILGENATPEAYEELREDLGLNDSIFVRYVGWLGDAVQGDLGRSYRLNQDVSTTLAERLPITIELIALTLIVGIVVSVPLGTLSAWKAGSRFDRIVTTASFGILALPSFLIAIGLIIVFAVKWGVLPATPAWVPFTEDPLQNLKNVILPVAATSLAEIAVLTRVLRSDMLQVLQSNHIETARAKGLSNRRILLRHALPQASLSLLTLIGLQIAGAMTGAVVLEQIFAIPGIGLMLLAAIQTRDLVLVQGTVLVVATAYVVINFLIDLTYQFADPRLRHG
jgi:peptide/nickel transport system permease protein